jgi:hypothetical protein
MSMKVNGSHKGKNLFCEFKEIRNQGVGRFALENP